MKKRLLAILLSLALVGGLLAAFTAVASSDSSSLKLAADTPVVCEKCGKPMHLEGFNKEHCEWRCEQLGCENAGKLITRNHDLEKEVVREPDCKTGKAGLVYYACKHCDYQREERIEATHKAIIDVPVEPTCTKPGKTAGRHCAICGAVIEAQKDIPALGHNYKVTKNIKPTCTTSGKKIEVCTRCGEKKETVIKPQHSFIKFTFAGRNFRVCAKCGDIRVIQLTKKEAKTESGKIREIIDGMVWDRIQEAYGSVIDNKTKFKATEIRDNIFQLNIDEASSKSKEPKLVALPLFAIFTDEGSKKPVSVKIPVEDLELEDEEKDVVVYITGNDEYEIPEGKVSGGKFSFKADKPGFLLVLKTPAIKNATKLLGKLAK